MSATTSDTVVRHPPPGRGMHHFYRLLLAWTRFDLAIAESTGRNPAHIGQLRQNEAACSKTLLDLETTP